ncbi:MAG: squalene--hopene cyclase [Planctomycetaceae bacterium]|nr:squalene--hopene cyclase [Planctomycetaceae bacterium]|tara:strand:+ start:626 stop:2545 length:1920 start_codon:yes stop_codon:yes gene_type:complete
MQNDVSIENPLLGSVRLNAAAAKSRQRLLDDRTIPVFWEGELATSALSTATAISTLGLLHQHYPMDNESLPERSELLVYLDAGTAWLADNQNEDGGWGDTILSYSNIATTILAIAAIKLAGKETQYLQTVKNATAYVDELGWIDGLKARYGKDKTFAVPILTNAALAGLVPWSTVASLPFELACFPQSFYRFLQLPVVSYAIPALVGIGQAKFFHRKPWNPISRIIRSLTVSKSLNVLEQMQPASGGYLEAIPLTSFVAMSLISTGRAAHPVTKNAVRFLMDTLRKDGSWPIDTNLSTWNTSLSINALNNHSVDTAALKVTDWLLNCQHTKRHPFTGADPGGWGWSDLSGAVPDCDDTPSAILALDSIRRSSSFDADDLPRIRKAAMAGMQWMLNLQNRDKGWPTFCRGWGKLPFDRSGADLSAHVLRALKAWETDLVSPDGLFANNPADLHRVIRQGFKYLNSQQNSDGSWYPLWFGNQDHPLEENPVYGTAKVLLAYKSWERLDSKAAVRGFDWLAKHQNNDGGWGSGVAHQRLENGRIRNQQAGSSVEETALAIEALLHSANIEHHTGVVEKGLAWLINRVETDRYLDCSPIGFYFAKLWYHERLYPLIFTVSTLGAALSRANDSATPPTSKSDIK